MSEQTKPVPNLMEALQKSLEPRPQEIDWASGADCTMSAGETPAPQKPTEKKKRRELPCPGCVWEADRIGEQWKHAGDCPVVKARMVGTCEACAVDQRVSPATICSACYSGVIQDMEDAKSERNDVEAENTRLRAALEEISRELPCDRPCRPERPPCETCGHSPVRVWCAGCVARAALKGDPTV